MNQDGKNVCYWFDMVRECIEQYILNVPQLFGFEFLNLLVTWKKVFVSKINNEAVIVQAWFGVEWDSAKFNIVWGMRVVVVPLSKWFFEFFCCSST
jgi:hypothetical protein